jgi:predicted RecB family nuclease
VAPAGSVANRADVAESPAGFAITSYRWADFAAYVRLVRQQLAETLGLAQDVIVDTYYPEPVEQCEVCRWWLRCNARRRQDDHPGFIAGASRLHRQELTRQGIATLAAAAAMPLPIPFKPARGSGDTYERIREQARLQHAQRTCGRPVHELLPLVDGQGLARLPEPSSGDLFLDLEAARFAREGGREYLFGFRGASGAPAQPHDQPCAFWATTDDEERAAFEATIDAIMQAWAADPGMHVYHFGHYEPAALKKLMGRYATRGDELDRLLRAERFVDLHAIVRQSLRAGVESYSIKQLERFYGSAAERHSVELALETGAASALPDELRVSIETYNRDDCRSALALRGWLEQLRAKVVADGAAIARPVAKPGEASDEVSELESRQQAAREQLHAGLAAEAITPGHPQHPYWLLGYLVDWHRREIKSEWWEFFRLSELPAADLFDERSAVAGLDHVARISQERFKNGNVKKTVDRYHYPAQETEIRRGSKLRSVGGAPFGVVVAHDRVSRVIDVDRGRGPADDHPPALFEAEVVNTNVQQEALLRLACAPDGRTCGADLLYRRPPQLTSGEFRQRDAETIVAFAVRLAATLDRTTLAIQGPPGAGKTYAGAQMIRALVRAGKKVGVTAGSHKVIRNLLDAVRAQERDAGAPLAAPDAGGQLRLDLDASTALKPIVLGHKCDPEDEGDEGELAPVLEFDKNEAALAALASGEIHILGGTTWLWARGEAVDSVDVLFVDEAGQMSLANALAVSGAASSLVLLGDPQQLDQPRKGNHPDGVGLSALEHVLGGAKIMPADRGLFLPTTWRLHPEICAFTSELFYEGKLESKPGLERQRLAGTGGFDGAGLWWMPVHHDGNQNYSSEEVDVVARLVEQVLAPGATWIDEHGIERQLVAGDLRIVSPFNAQVNRIAERLAGLGVPTGTVDKFQGQEAPIVIYSMATSRSEDAPRGMEFLYSLNRFNVATSRARCAAIVVASHRLLEPDCRTPKQMMLANALCRYVELARSR